MTLAEEIQSMIECVYEILGKPLTHNEIRIVDRGCPHEPPKNLEGGAAVYCYIYNSEFLKIGKANKNSKSRFVYHHYRVKHSFTKHISKIIEQRPKHANFWNERKLNHKTVDVAELAESGYLYKLRTKRMDDKFD